MRQKEKILFDMIKSALFASNVESFYKNQLSDNDIEEVLDLSKKHDISHLVMIGLEKNNLCSEEIRKKWRKVTLQAICRYEGLNHDFDMLCNALDEADIPYLPLKGAVIRRYYPEEWMRTSSDIDILVKEKDLEKTILYLNEKLKLKKGIEDSHDVSLYSENGTHIELHFDLLEKGRGASSDKVLSLVWERAVKKENSCFYEMSFEMLYFYHVAHMAKHFEIGGCGIRPFIDLYLLDKNNLVREKCDELLEKGGLSAFEKQARNLAYFWFENSKAHEITLKMQDYIINGGLYGSRKNHIRVQTVKKGGKEKFILKRIWLSYDEIKVLYPKLKKHKYLLPYYEVHRWIDRVHNGKIKASLKEMDFQKSIKKEEMEETKEFLKELGLF